MKNVGGIGAVYVLALSLWMGGLVVLGAIVAPTVFRIVPAPTSADAMTIVFRRFDVIAIACAVIGLVAEAVLTRATPGKPTKLDLVRVGSLVLAAILAIAIGTWLSPAIHALHRDGAVRGFGEPGLMLEVMHKRAEACAKAELVFLLLAIILLVLRLARPHPAKPKDPL